MRHTFIKSFSLISVLTAFFCVGCAPMTEAEWEEREYARVEWREQFRTDRRECFARGGYFVYDGVAELGRDGVPKTRVFYACS
jgi:hypothetical protein